jgi:hypothetical protein
MTPSLTETDLCAAVRSVLLQLLPAGVEVVRGRVNRVPEVTSDDFVTMLPMLQTRLATNVTTYTDTWPGTTQTRTDTKKTQLTVQLDVHGPNAAQNAEVLATYLRSDVAEMMFKGTGVAPLYADDPRFIPYTNEAGQVENRYVVNCVVQADIAITMPQDFAGALSFAGLHNVTASTGYLSVKGDQILAPTGLPIVLRGWNWRRWGAAQPQDGADNAAQGANCVRIPLRWWDYDSGNASDSRDDNAPGNIDPARLGILDAMVAQAGAARLWIILTLDSDCGQNGTQDGATKRYCDPQNTYGGAGRNFFTDLDARRKFIRAWQFIAARYKNAAFIGLFEPLPEINPPGGWTDDGIKQLYDDIMKAIRAVAPGIPFLVGSRGYDITQPSNGYNAAWKDVVYTGDLIQRTGGTQSANLQDTIDRLHSLTQFRTNKGVPVFIQQAGVQSGDDDPSFSYLNNMLANIAAAKVGFTYAQYRDGQTPSGFAPKYQGSDGRWLTKSDWLATIVSYLNAPR